MNNLQIQLPSTQSRFLFVMPLTPSSDESDEDTKQKEKAHTKNYDEFSKLWKDKPFDTKCKKDEQWGWRNSNDVFICFKCWLQLWQKKEINGIVC